MGRNPGLRKWKVNKPSLIMDDPEAVQILAAYYPPVDGVRNEDRKKWALQKWQQLHPNGDNEHAWPSIQKILEAEGHEHRALCTYFAIMTHNAILIREAISFIDKHAPNVETGSKNAFAVWRAIEEILHRAAAISRMFDVQTMKASSQKEIDLRVYRSELLKSGLGVTGPFLAAIRTARNMVEHFEEYIDEKVQTTSISLVDLQCLDAERAARVKGELLRWYDPERKEIHVFREVVRVKDLEDLTLEIVMVLHATVFLRGRYHVQFNFGLRDIPT